MLALTGCSSDDPPVAEPPLPPSPTVLDHADDPRCHLRATDVPAPTPAPGTVPPPWLGTRPLPLRPDGYGQVQPTPPELDPRRFTLPDTLAPLPGDGFASVVENGPRRGPGPVAPGQPACPVGADDLAYVQLTFWGFDDQRHTGELLLNRAVADDVVGVFRTLYDEQVPVRGAAGHPALRARRATRPGDGNNTGSFVCRPTTGSTTTFSQHAYGLAIDLDPFQNPYTKDDLVLPELASSYLDRDDVRPGMITPDGVVVRAFESIGWTWGGTWRSLKDYQHFSQNGR